MSKISQVTDSDFKSQVLGGGAVLVDFWGPG